MASYSLPNWYRLGECRKHPELEFVPKGQPTARTPYAAQREVCTLCPVRVHCLDEALAGGHDYVGIWGGTDERERRRLLRAREAA